MKYLLIKQKGNTMKYLLILMVLFTISILGQSYTFEGVDCFDYSQQEGFELVDQAVPDIFIKYDVGYFNHVVIFSNDRQSVMFQCKNPSAMKFNDIYSKLVKLMGRTEDRSGDYIPDSARGDAEYTATLIYIGSAKIVRAWDIDDEHSMGIVYDEEGLSVLWSTQ